MPQSRDASPERSNSTELSKLRGLYDATMELLLHCQPYQRIEILHIAPTQRFKLTYHTISGYYQLNAIVAGLMNFVSDDIKISLRGVSWAKLISVMRCGVSYSKIQMALEAIQFQMGVYDDILGSTDTVFPDADWAREIEKLALEEKEKVNVRLLFSLPDEGMLPFRFEGEISITAPDANLINIIRMNNTTIWASGESLMSLLFLAWSREGRQAFFQKFKFNIYFSATRAVAVATNATGPGNYLDFAIEQEFQFDDHATIKCSYIHLLGGAEPNVYCISSFNPLGFQVELPSSYVPYLEDRSLQRYGQSPTNIRGELTVAAERILTRV